MRPPGESRRRSEQGVVAHEYKRRQGTPLVRRSESPRRGDCRLLDAFPDLAIVADDVIADGGKVAVRWHVNATHKGDSLGFPPSNRRVSFRGMTWLEFDEGRIVRGWDNWNLGGLIESLTSPQ